MTQEEKQIQAIAGNRTPYRVPEGYFSAKAQQISHQCTEHSKRHLHLLRRYLIGGVAALLIALFTLPLLWWNLEEQQKLIDEEYELYLYSQMDEDTFYNLYFTNY